MQDRKTGTLLGSRFRAMDSSSVVARDWVSRSESLLRQMNTRCLRFWGGVEEGDIVIHLMLQPPEMVKNQIFTVEKLGAWRRSFWDFRQHRRSFSDRFDVVFFGHTFSLVTRSAWTFFAFNVRERSSAVVRKWSWAIGKGRDLIWDTPIPIVYCRSCLVGFKAAWLGLVSGSSSISTEGRGNLYRYSDI